MICAQCRNQATFVQQYGQWWCESCRTYIQAAQAPPSPQALQKARQARKLVNLSHALGWGGLGFLILGPILGAAAFKSGTVAAVLALLGLVSAIIGAIVGQVGRAQQGRVI